MTHVRDLTGGVRLGIQPPLGSGLFTLDVSQLDVDTLAAGLWVMTDFSDQVRQISARRGRSTPFGLYQAGTGQALLGNHDGSLTFSLEPSPGAVRPGSPIEIGGKVGGVGPLDPVFTGVVDTFTATRNMAGTDETVLISATDALRDLSETDLPAQAVQGGGELPGARINRILDNLDPPPPTTQRDIDDGQVTLQSTNLAQPLITNAELAVSSEGGALFIDRKGKWVFRERAHVGATRPPLGDTALYPYRPTNISVAWSGEFVRNDITLARSGGAAQQAVNAASIAAIRKRRTYRRVDLIANNDADVLDLATHLVNLWVSYQSIETLTIQAARDPWATLVTSYELTERFEISRAMAAGAITDLLVRIDGISHHWTSGQSWVTSLNVSTLPN